MDKRVIDVNTKSWCNKLDIYDAVLKAIDAPDWHGESVDALIDSIIYGGINGLVPPYVIRFQDTDGLPNDIAEELRIIKDAIDRARLERQKSTGIYVDVELAIV